MATNAEPDPTVNEKLVFLEERIAQLELQLENAKPQEQSPPATNSTVLSTTAPATGTAEKQGDKAQGSATGLPTTEAKVLPSLETRAQNGMRSLDDAGTPQPSPDGTVANEEPKKASRIRNVIRQWNEEEKDWEDVPQPKKRSPEKTDDSELVPRAFTYRKTFGNDGTTVTSVEIVIEDDKLYGALKKAICKVYGDSYYTSWPTKTFATQSPFQKIIHCYDELEQASLTHDDDDDETLAHKEDIRLLLDAVRTSPDLASYFKSRSETPSTIAFKYLWTLFPPGTEVVSRKFFNHWQLFRVDQETEVLTPEELDEKPSSWDFAAWCYDWDGRHGDQYLRVSYRFKIDYFDTPKEISQLSCYPLKYFRDTSTSQEKDTPDTLKRKLLITGKRFMEFCSAKGAQRMFEYDDLAMTMDKTRANALLKNDDTRSQYRSRYRDISPEQGAKRIKAVYSRSKAEQSLMQRLMSNEVAYLSQPACEIPVDSEAGSGSLHLGDDRPLDLYEPDEALQEGRAPVAPEGEWARLCPPRILGYSLEQKQMLQFKLSRAITIEERRSKNSFENELQLKKEQKDMLLALIDHHESGDNPTNSVEDIIEGKGRSLVILLHGPPGVGKTLTAETVAKATGKPLIMVSVAEIGLQADQAESKLEQIFRYAAKWEGILLVDEADVFLEARSSDAGTERNALVSVLLRVLEYYTGTIILTTNRISSLDIAVQSRIHLSIRYDDLSPKDCIAIFRQFIEEAEFEENERDRVVKWFEEDVSEEKLNGRQIRNLVTSAQAIAKSHKKGLDYTSFKSVFKVTQDFQKQLTEQTMRARALNEVGSGRGGK